MPSTNVIWSRFISTVSRTVRQSARPDRRPPQPAIFTCRRPRDGGYWSGSEEERLTLLRQAVVDGANYIDIELDVANEIRKFPGCKRVISITDLEGTPHDLANRYARALEHAPDVVRLTTRADSLEEAMPLLKLLVRTRVPTVVQAVGKASVMVNLMARKLGAPWTYAALERGMEVYPDQSSVQELNNVYHIRAIGPRTPLFGIAGLSEREYGLIAGLNAGLAWHGAEARCWPFHLLDAGSLPAVARQFKLTGLFAGAAHTNARATPPTFSTRWPGTRALWTSCRRRTAGVRTSTPRPSDCGRTAGDT